MSVFLQACRREAVPHTPIWIMRQAGRYQPEYRALRARVGFMELCRTPELACEVTVLAARQLGVDAAIIFADILLVLEPLGIGFEFTDDGGPRIRAPIRTREQVDQVAAAIDASDSLSYVMEAIRLTRRELAGSVPLIGFAGAPFTLASYVIEGSGSKEYYETKQLMYREPATFQTLMHRLSDAVIDYLRAQVDAGAEALQIFDSWVGCLSPGDYAVHVHPHMRRIFAALPTGVPVIHFGTGNAALYPLMKEAGGDVIGMDWRVDLGEMWTRLGSDVGVMGNLDPAVLLAPRATMQEAARAVLQSAAGRRGHIFNLGHGIMPSADPAQAKALVDFVHEASSR